MNTLKKTVLFSGFIFVFLLLNTPLLPQAGRGKGRINGKVTDDSGKAVVSAKVVIQFLENENITREVTTDKNGKWKIGGLGSGNWSIMVTAQGYLPYQDRASVSQLERNPPINIVLKRIEESILEDAPEIELFEKGNQLFNDEKYDEAIASYKGFLEKNPELYQVHYSLGNCYKEKGEFEQALKEYQVILEKATEEKEKERKIKAKTLAAIGECYLKKEDFDSAQNYFKQSLELIPDDEILAYNVGEIYFSHQKMDEAIEYFKLSSQIKPDWSDSCLKLGYVYLNIMDNTNALKSFEKFLELEPDTTRAASVQNIVDYLKKQ